MRTWKGATRATVDMNEAMTSMTGGTIGTTTTLNFKQFAEWFRASHPHTAKQDDDEWRQLRDDVERGILPEAALKNKIGMARRFDRYRKEYYSRQLYSVFLTHRASAWFVERYSPASAALRRRVNRSGRVPAVVQFISALRAGEYASVSFDENAPPRPNAMDRPLEDGDDKRVEIDAPSGQVFVKTVPPTTRRVDLEKLFGKAKGFQWLALSDPSVKKAFHRVGWAQYAEGTDPEMVVRAVDGQKIDMFTFHMGINNTPSIGRVRFAPSACGTLAQLEADLERAKELAIMLEDDLVESDEDKGDAEAAAGNTDSNDAQAERQPMPWDRAAPLHERGSRHVQNTLDAMDQPDFGGDVDAARLAQTKSALDLWIAYLRYGLHTCFYCLAPCSFAEELHRKCIAHVRSPPERDDQDKIDKEERGADRGDERDERDRDERDPKADRRPAPNSKSSDERWLELFDNKFRAMVKGDVADAGGRDVAEETSKLAAPYIKKETADKYRCKQCDKLFRAPEFVIKHVASKHGELVSDKLEEVSLFNAFVRDATHLQPDKNTPASIDDKLPAPLLPLIEGMMGGFGAASRTPSRIGNTGPAVNPALMPGAAGMDGPGFNLQQQMMMMLQMGMMMGTGGGSGGSGGMGGGVMGAAGGMSGIGMGVMGGGTGMAGPMSQRPRRDLDAPPASGPTNEDPRASRGRVSYLDLDEEPGGGGDGGLPY
ncbi:hypothetical protein Q5752_005112 [Cryptotrichosporon argae]